MKLTIIAGRVIESPERELSDREQRRIARTLAAQGIQVEPVTDVFRTVHLWAKAPVSTEQEVRALYAFREATDARLAFHRAEAGR